MHWDRILRNIFSNGASYLVTAVVGFTLSPVVVHSLGNTGYGLWTLVLSLTGYFGLLDLGIRSSVGRFVARHIALKDHLSVNRTLNTAFAILACGGALALLATLAMALFFFDSFKVEPQYQVSGRIALAITGLNMACVLPLGIFTSLLVALERYDVLGGITIVGELTRAVLVLASLKAGYGLVTLALIGFLVVVLQYSAIILTARRFFPELRFGAGLVDRQMCRSLFGFGVYRFIWIVANQLIFYSDSVVIGVYLNAAAITPYAIAGSLINYGRNVVSLVTDTFYPTAARMDAEGDMAGLRRLLIQGTRVSLLVALPLCLGFIFLGKQFIVLWMGKNYASSAAFLIVLTIPQFGSMSQYISSLVLAGMARHRALAFFIMAEGIANLALSIYLVQRMGVVGVAWGTVIPDLICTTLVVPVYALRCIKMSVREYLVDAFLRPVLCAIPIAAIAYACSVMFETASWLLFGAEVAVICGVFAVLAYFLCLDRQQRNVVMGKVGAMFQREVVLHES